MLPNYLKIAWRNLIRNKVYSAINIGGLAIGLTACLLMFLYVQHEFTYDGFHTNQTRIIRITSHLKTPEAPMSVAGCPTLLADVLNQNYPEVERAVRFEPVSATIRLGDKLWSEPSVYYTDPAVFNVFTYPFVAGNPALALSEPNTAVVTESFARKYMGPINAIGRSFQCNTETYRITGVLADLPSNTDLPVNVLLAKKGIKATSWLAGDFPAYTFVLFRETPDLRLFGRKLALLSQRSIQPEFKQLGAEGYALNFQTEPLRDVHFSQGKEGDLPKGDKVYGYLFAFLAVFVLVIALLNYINLLTARATGRAKEVGIRKASGAVRAQLVGQFLFESLLLSTIAVLLAIALVVLVIPFLNQLVAIRLAVRWQEGITLASGAVFLTTLLGGFYPALILSGFDPANALRGQFGTVGRGLWFRRSIIVFQFALAFGMIVGVLVVWGQTNYLQQTSLGFQTEQVVTIPLPDDSLARTSAIGFAGTLRQRSEISSVSLGSGLQPNALLAKATTIFQTNGRKRETLSNYFFIDEEFLPLLNIRLTSGRNLANTSEAEKTGTFLVNEAFVKMAGWKQAIGQNLEGFMHKGKVVGVVRNFNYRSLHNPIEPLVLVYNTFPPSVLTLKMRPEQLPLVAAGWKAHYPNFPFEYRFLDQSFEAQYHKDRLMMTLFNGFAILTVLVSCLGLFGLATFTAEARTKEIGIRKVLGASVASIVALLSQDFLKLMLIAIVIASPVAWYAMNRWLQDFAYKIDIEWWVFAGAGGLAVGIALLTVSFQSVKAALMNPVKSLRSE